METKRENPIPEKKIKAVQELKDLLTNNKTILIASIKDLPASQFQEISKKLRGKAIIKVPRKNLLFRAIDDSKNENLNKLKEYFRNSVAILFSDEESFDLASMLLKNKSPAKAKPGQEAPEDIIVEAGPTDLPPGPAISELGAVGLQVQIDKGKIMIKETKAIVKKGGKISQAAADIMSKLDIKPFSIGFIPLSAIDNENKKFYSEININPEGTLEALKQLYGKALAVAVSIGYANEDTIKFMLGKANAYEKALGKLIKEDAPKEEPKAEEKATPTEANEAPAETQTPEVKTEETESPMASKASEEPSGEENK